MTMDERGVHLTHCNQGEYLGGCKYGEDATCPALGGPCPPHLFVPEDAGLSDGSCWMGSGVPLHFNSCTKCGERRGPFMAADYGEGY